ncbi:MAG: lysine--tRNA ligase [Alphaproteobacteria bacterium]|nr:lysine--tRNA ligase [Alphaproteobacteria bacterium]
MPVDLATTKAWPFQEAARVANRYRDKTPGKGYVLFATGYGPSGLPHIGTFGEVARTSMVRRAFAEISSLPTKLFAFSDDMDGLRKVPDNVPQREMMAKFIGMPLTSVPDPFGTHPSFGQHNNARLRSFLDSFGFEYEFWSATDCYRRGFFDPILRKVLEHYVAVSKVILPTLRPERRATYSPFMPVCPKTGRVLQVPLVERKVDSGTVVYRDEDGKLIEVPVTGGQCKLQWKIDWAMRWVALGVDYEMSGKDLIDSIKASSQVCRILGGTAPETFVYELFLDEKGEKISKSRGNGLTIEEWLTYAAPESLALYMFQAPRKAKRLYFDVIPRAVDEYVSLLEKFPGETPEARRDNPVWHIHAGKPPKAEVPVSFGLLLNLASVCNTEDRAVLWGFISRYVAGATPERFPLLDRLVGYALRYYQDFVKPNKVFRAPSETERQALSELASALSGLPATADAEAIQFQVYEVGKRYPFANLRDWFASMYQVLFGQTEGPRIGSFIALYGIADFVTLIEGALRRP